MPPICDTKCGASPAAALEALLEGLIFIAGEVEFDGFLVQQEFIFTQVAAEIHPLPAGALNADSNLFDSPSPGTLRYVGAEPLRARVSYSAAFIWVSATGGVTKNAFFTELLINGAIAGETVQGTTLDIGADNYTIYNATADTMLTLQPGDQLQVNVAAFIPATYTINISSLTIVANRV